MQRNFEPMRKQAEAWRGTRLADEAAKLVIYRAFVEGELGMFRSIWPESCTVRSTDHVVPVECVNFCLQRTGSHSTVPGDRQAGSIS